jgi:hypothetical protein
MKEKLKLDELLEIINSEELIENTVSSLAKDLNLSERTAYLIKFRIIELTQQELSQIAYFDLKTLEILGIISLQDSNNRKKLINEFNTIYSSNNPFDIIESIVYSGKTPNILDLLSDKYWNCIHDYLLERSINQYPFNLTSIRFIKSISKTKYSKLSDKQRNWIDNLISADINGFDPNPIFSNSILINKGLENDYRLMIEHINDYKK